MRGAFWLLVGVVVFVAITFLEQVPVLGWIGGIVSIGAWIALTRGLWDDRGWDVPRGTIGLVWSAFLGAVTGFIGALTAWLAQTGNLFGFTTAPGDRFGALFGFIGASVGLILWPLIGAAVCVITALAIGSGRLGSR